MGSEWARSGHLRSVWSLHWYPSWHLTEQCFELHSTVPSVALLVTLKSSTFSRQTSGGIIFLAVSFPKTGSTGKTTGSSHKELTFIFSKFSFWKFFSFRNQNNIVFTQKFSIWYFSSSPDFFFEILKLDADSDIIRRNEDPGFSTDFKIVQF